MLGAFLRDQNDSQTLRQKSGVKDIVVFKRENKIRLAKHTARLAGKQWMGKKTITWINRKLQGKGPGDPGDLGFYLQ